MSFETTKLPISDGISKTKVLEIENIEDTNEIALFGRALSQPVRIEILRLLNKKPRLVSEIAQILGLQLSSVAFHVKVMEEAGLLTYDYSTKGKSSLKFYYAAPYKTMLITRQMENTSKNATPIIKNIHIGDYVDAELNTYCGIASETRCLMQNSPHLVFIPEKRNAQLIWCRESGYLSYYIDNEYAKKERLESVSFSLELCSEARGFNEDYPSDITFWINNVELCTWTCPGDYGDKYGDYTPSWWFTESTKYGLLTVVCVKKNGVYINDRLVNKHVNLTNLKLENGNKTSFKFGVKKDANFVGGFNVFGDKFGNHNQAIIFRATYK